jgi:hypothetical protein
MQIKDLNSGTFGFVQLARDKHTNETWAIKFIERGDKVSMGCWAREHLGGTAVGVQPLRNPAALPHMWPNHTDYQVR